MKAEMVFWTCVLGVMIDGSMKRLEGAMFGEQGPIPLPDQGAGL
jgi:hypothetical protein